MCGIAGIYSSLPTTFDSAHLKQISDLLQHRGPDAEGVFSDAHIALVHQRLKIIDLSDAANQPMHAQDHVLIFNGEIYNYPTLRLQLEKSGCIFKTNSDTEVLLNGLIKFEEFFISQLEGDFSFCFYNKKTGSVLIARDRFGVKPLYLSRHKGKIFFSSEIKPLFAAGVPSTINYSVIREYFQYRYVGGHDTLFEGVTHFPPGHYLKIADSKESLVSYDQPLSLCDESRETLSFKDAFKKSVAGRLLSDRTLSLLLSSGIDSSALAAQINALGHKTSTLTYSFNTRNDELDEYAAAEKLALSLQFVPKQIKEGSSDFLSYPDIIKSLEEPLGDSVVLANSRLFQEAKKSSIVLLSGEGADELFSGYAHHRTARIIGLIKRVWFLPAIASVILRIVPLSLLNRLSFYPVRLSQHLKDRLLAALKTKSEAELFSLLASLFAEVELNELLVFKSPVRKSFFRESFFVTDFTNWLPKYGLLRLDKLSMAHSLEVRVPYLSHELIQAARAEGFHRSSVFGQEKKSFRRFCKSVLKLPDAVVGKKKQPFFNPEIENLNPAYLDYLKQTLTAERLEKFKILSYPFVLRLLETEKHDFLTLKKLNCILIFHIWCETFFGAESS